MIESLSLQAFAQALPLLGPYIGVIFALAVVQLAVIIRVADKKARVWLLSATISVQMLAALAMIVVSAISELKR